MFLILLIGQLTVVTLTTATLRPLMDLEICFRKQCPVDPDRSPHLHVVVGFEYHNDNRVILEYLFV